MLPLPQPARHVVLLVTPRVAAADLDAYPEYPGEKVEVPNLRTAARLGVRVRGCRLPAGEGGPGLRALLGLDGPGESLLERVAREGTLLITWLPHREAAWLASEGGAGPRWDVWVPEISMDEPFSWPELLAAGPRLRVRGERAGDDVRGLLEDRILARFPGEATRQRYDGQGRDPRAAARHWCAWVGDAFLRTLWVALARAEGGTFSVVAHPGPAALGRAFGAEGYRYGVEQVDELVGRLLLLREHESAADLALLVTADAAPAQGGFAPAIYLGPGLPEGAVADGAGPEDLRRVLQAALS